MTPEDVDVLLSMGKRSVYVWEMQPGMLHENDAALRLCALAEGPGCTHKPDIKEGKIELAAAYDGCFTVRSEALLAVNRVPQVMVATRKGNTAVRVGEKLAGMRVIPLVIDEATLDEADAAAAAAPAPARCARSCRFACVAWASSPRAARWRAALSRTRSRRWFRQSSRPLASRWWPTSCPATTWKTSWPPIDRVREAGVDLVVCTEACPWTRTTTPPAPSSEAAPRW